MHAQKWHKCGLNKGYSCTHCGVVSGMWIIGVFVGLTNNVGVLYYPQ